MPKFARLLACLRETGLLQPIQEFVPEPAPRAWLELAHAPSYVAGVLEQRLDAVSQFGAECAMPETALPGGAYQENDTYPVTGKARMRIKKRP